MANTVRIDGKKYYLPYSKKVFTIMTGVGGGYQESYSFDPLSDMVEIRSFGPDRELVAERQEDVFDFIIQGSWPPVQSAIEKSGKPNPDFGDDGWPPKRTKPHWTDPKPHWTDLPAPPARKDTMPVIPGTRIKIPNGPSGWLTGTVVTTGGAFSDLPRGAALLCMDVDNRSFTDYPELCGAGHGFISSAKDIRLMKMSSRDSKHSLYEGVPPHIGVYVPKSFKYKNIIYEAGSTARVLAIRNEAIVLQWLGEAGRRSTEAVTLPKQNLHWCLFKPGTEVMGNPWPFDGRLEEEFKAGDILVYISDKSIKLPMMESSDAITKGVLLRCLAGGERGHINAEIVSGMEKHCIGFKFQPQRNQVRRFSEAFIPEGKEVEVVVDVMFRRRSLKGKKGKVILATDSEGDVGVEFPEDLNAGSLDGWGAEGQCLYIPVDSVKETSE